jgi:hypothetical protein
MEQRALVYLVHRFSFIIIQRDQERIHVQRTGSEIRDQGWAAAVKTRVLQTSAESLLYGRRIVLQVLESFLYGYRMQLFLLCVWL